VEGLPEQAGATGLAVVALGLLLGTGAWLLARRWVAAGLGRDARDPVTLLLATTLAAGVAAVPLATWRIVEDIRYTSSLDSWLADNYGVSVYEVHPALYDELRRLIPPGDTYYLRAGRTQDPTSAGAFREWALGILLPRVAVESPDDADWLVTLGVDPRSVGPRVDRVWVVHPAGQGVPAAYLGRVQA
jgi:hypothetical protein